MNNEIENIKQRAKERIEIQDKIIQELEENNFSSLKVFFELVKENIKYVVYNETSVSKEKRNNLIKNFIKGVKQWE
ncbi:MAG: hypothetical protein LUH05_04175 [Candidatus Gastranaerophilales bacterium]|nr:hypothetical protein [Candidatus Gastranaerophilales bacterium]